MWSHVLRDQLQTSEAEFWACVHDGRLPTRTAGPASTAALPADLVHLLINRVGLADAEVATMSRDAAIERMQRYWTTPNGTIRTAAVIRTR